MTPPRRPTLTLEPLGSLESVVMDAVWSHGPSCARELQARLRGRRARAYTTIMTTMDRLYRKGLLLREKDGPAFRYHAALGREAFERALTDRLVGEILAEHGDVAVAAFVDAASGDPALLDRLTELLARHAGRDP